MALGYIVQLISGIVIKPEATGIIANKYYQGMQA